MTWPFKRCSGAHCQVRESCAHHALPSHERAGDLVHPPRPIREADDCAWYAVKQWGAGPDNSEGE